MYDLATIKAMNKESGDENDLGKAMTYQEICDAADAERIASNDENWPEPRNEF